MGKKIITAVLLLLAALALVYMGNPSLFAPRTAGSFEYIRKGELFLEKGECKKAIFYFEKALDSSPENSRIKEYLGFAYSKQGMALADSGDYDRAIEYLIKACETRPSANAIQNLASVYVKRALARYGRNDAAGAMEDFKVARYAVSDSTHAAKNLAIILFNSAIIEYNEGRMKQAITCLKESALIDEDYRTLELLGDIYYKLTELQNASFYWKKALDANPAKTEISEKIERVSKEIDLAASEEKRKLAHFELRYAKTLPFDVKAAEPLLDQAYRDVGRDLGYFPAGRTVIFLYPEEEFRRLFKLPPMVRAFYDGNIRMPIPPGELKGEELARYLYHEYTHAVVSAMTNTRCPVWFSEGIAVWEEFDKKDFAQGVLKIDARGSFNLSLAALNTAFEGGAKTRDMRPYYVMAYTVVTFIVDNWGVGGLRGLLKRIASGQHIMNAIDDEFLLSEREFEERWNRYLREKYR